MKGLETTCNKDKFVIALVTTCSDGDWRSSQIIPSTPKTQNIGSLIPVQELSWNKEMTLRQLQIFV